MISNVDVFFVYCHICRRYKIVENHCCSVVFRGFVRLCNWHFFLLCIYSRHQVCLFVCPCSCVCECLVQRAETTISWLWATATVHPFPPSSVGRKLEQRPYACVTLWLHCVCVFEREDERSHSYYIKQDFPEQSAPATELPKSFSGFPLQQKVGGLAENPLFVLEHHCSGGAEAMSQHRRHSAHLPRNAQLLNVRLLLCHLAFPHGIYSGRNHSCTPIIGRRKASFSLLSLSLLFFPVPRLFWCLVWAHRAIQLWFWFLVTFTVFGAH